MSTTLQEQNEQTVDHHCPRCGILVGRNPQLGTKQDCHNCGVPLEATHLDVNSIAWKISIKSTEKIKKRNAWD